MEEIVRKTMLFDFYGDLLTEHQREIYEAVVLNDTGYSEVAQEEGISRQGVHDLVRRCDRQLEAYESKLGLMERFLRIRQDALTIRSEAELIGADRIKELADKIVGEL